MPQTRFGCIRKTALYNNMLAVLLRALIWGALHALQIRALRITYEIKPGIFDEKRGNAALLIKNSGFYFIFNP